MIFIDGLKVRKQDFSNGDFIIKLSVNFDTFVECVGNYIKEDGYINIDCKQSRKDDSKWYAVLDEWKPNK